VGSAIKKFLRFSKIGYVPMSHTFEQPGDSRRFVFYANARDIPFELADPAKNYDVVVLTQAADLSVWSRYSSTGAKIVYDFIDSYLAIPRTDIKGWVRGPAKYFAGKSRYFYFDQWKAIAAMCKRADAVVCSTQAQRKDISKFCSNVYIILDSQAEVLRQVKNSYKCGKPFRLVWEGLPQNLEPLKPVVELLAASSLKDRVELHIISDPSYKRYLGRLWSVNTTELVSKFPLDCVFHEWHPTTLSAIACDCDLAIIPVDLSDPFSRGKPENKLLLFWRMGLPVVVSATPCYSQAMRAAGLDDAICDNQGWLVKLSGFMKDESLRQRAALLGREHATNHFQLSDLLERWDQMFESIGFSVS
jgi:hypothetical protein